MERSDSPWEREDPRPWEGFTLARASAPGAPGPGGRLPQEGTKVGTKHPVASGIPELGRQEQGLVPSPSPRLPPSAHSCTGPWGQASSISGQPQGEAGCSFRGSCRAEAGRGALPRSPVPFPGLAHTVPRRDTESCLMSPGEGCRYPELPISESGTRLGHTAPPCGRGCPLWLGVPPRMNTGRLWKDPW